MEQTASPLSIGPSGTRGPGPAPPAVDVVVCLGAVACRLVFPPATTATGGRASPSITDQPWVIDMLCCPSYIAKVLYGHLRVIVQRRLFSVCEEEHGGQGHPHLGEASAVEDSAPWLPCRTGLQGADVRLGECFFFVFQLSLQFPAHRSKLH